MIRPSRQPCSSATGDASVAPAARASRVTEAELATTSSVRLVAAPSLRGLSRFGAADVPATQNAASPTASCATMSSPAPTRCRTVAPKAAS